MAVCNTVFVKSVNPGGRLFSAVDTAEVRKNGQIGKLGAYEPATQSTIKAFKKLEAADITNTQPIGIVMQPEMMYDNSRKSLQKLDLFEIEANDPFVFVPLEEGDKIEISADLVTGGNIAQAQVGHVLTLTNNSVLYTHTNNNQAPGQAGSRYFEIVKIRDLHARRPYIAGKYVPAAAEKMYTIELKVKR